MYYLCLELLHSAEQGFRGKSGADPSIKLRNQARFSWENRSRAARTLASTIAEKPSTEHGEHRFLECSGTQGSNFSRARGGGENMNPGFELVEPRFNLEFEIYVQTLGFGNSMFEPGVLELYVRTLGSGTLCSNRGLENSMLEPRVWELLPPSPESLNPG